LFLKTYQFVRFDINTPIASLTEIILSRNSSLQEQSVKYANDRINNNTCIENDKIDVISLLERFLQFGNLAQNSLCFLAMLFN
jgi:hypothetical protein